MVTGTYGVPLLGLAKSIYCRLDSVMTLLLMAVIYVIVCLVTLGCRDLIFILTGTSANYVILLITRFEKTS